LFRATASLACALSLAGATAARSEVLRVPGEFASVTSALREAKDGDRVEIAPGTYSAATGEDFPLQLEGRRVELVGAGAGRTVLHGDGAVRLLLFRNGDASTVADLTLAGGFAEDAGGAVRITDARPQLLRIRLTGNESATGGDAVVVDGGRPRLANCLLDGNGGQGPTVLVRAGNPVIEHATLHGNAGAAFEVHGDASPVLRASIVSHPGEGGGPAVGVRVVPGRGLGVPLLERNLFEACFEGTVQIQGDADGILAAVLGDARRLDGLREGDPLFVNPSDGDFRLREGSPGLPFAPGAVQLGAFGGSEPLRVARDDDGDDDPEDDAAGLLGPSVPNPFTPATTIHFTVPRAGAVDLGVYNVLGRRIRTLLTGDLSAGEHSRVWDGRDDLGAEAPPGIYFVRITQGEATESRRLVLVR
jgi:hypothetical protein